MAQFLVVGGLAFAASVWLAPEPEDPRVLVIDEAVQEDLVDLFGEEYDRAPEPGEMNALMDRWVLNEALYREAMALGLDRGDEMIRERVAQKMRVMMLSQVTVEDPSEDELREWFEARRALYDEPATLSFRLARIDGTEAEARAVVERLRDGEAPAGAGARAVYPYAERPRPVVEQVLGRDVTAAIEALEPGRWEAVETPGGWQAARLDALEPGQRTAFEAVRGRVRVDWEQRAFRDASHDMLGALVDGYAVVAAPYEPARWQARFQEDGRRAAAEPEPQPELEVAR